MRFKCAGYAASASKRLRLNTVKQQAHKIHYKSAVEKY